METDLYFARFVQGNASEYARQLGAYAQLMNASDDVRRLKALAADLRGEKDVVVGMGEESEE